MRKKNKSEVLQLTTAQEMPIASAVEKKDTVAMQQILLQALPNRIQRVDDVAMEASQGKMFTGGRSTPVYKVSCRIRKENGTTVHRYFVVKLVQIPESDRKTAIRRESYAVERRFYDSTAIQERLQSAALTIPKLLAGDLDGSKAWPCFCILMNDLSTQYPMHPDCMSVHQAVCGLQWIATFHATFWGDQYPRVLWERGAFWTQSCHANRIAVTWVATHQFVESKYPHFVTTRTMGVGQRLQIVGHAISSFLAEYAQNRKYRTVIHGDYKSANMFFSKETEQASCTERGSQTVAVIDFQYAGGGIGAEDVAYFLYPDARGEWFAQEEMLLKTYHETLIAQLIFHRKGGPSTLPFETFVKFYELARLDMTRYWLSKGWIASTEGEAKLVGALERALDGIDGGSVLSSDDEYEAALCRFVWGS